MSLLCLLPSLSLTLTWEQAILNHRDECNTCNVAEQWWLPLATSQRIVNTPALDHLHLDYHARDIKFILSKPHYPGKPISKKGLGKNWIVFALHLLKGSSINWRRESTCSQERNTNFLGWWPSPYGMEGRMAMLVCLIWLGWGWNVSDADKSPKYYRINSGGLWKGGQHMTRTEWGQEAKMATGGSPALQNTRDVNPRQPFCWLRWKSKDKPRRASVNEILDL